MGPSDSDHRQSVGQCSSCHRDRYAQCQTVHKTMKTPQVQFLGEVVDAPVVLQRQVQNDGSRQCRKLFGGALFAVSQVVNFPVVAQRQILMVQFSEYCRDSPVAVH